MRTIGALLIVTFGFGVLAASQALALASPANAAHPQQITIKAAWGIITAPNVKAPKPGKCVKIKVKIDVRNAANTPVLGVNMGIVDDFDNLIAYAQWENIVAVDGKIDWSKTFVRKPNGVYVEPMTACAKASTWTDPYRVNNSLPLIAAKANELYEFVAVTESERLTEGEVKYAWKK